MVHFKDRLFLDNHDRAQHVKKKKKKMSSQAVK